ncbi:MAG: D-aminoacyl-tRNA deacylase, partial [Candidatus Electryoneaceae bacterium]|nr:D-aminoacyl-tRNA deacylase [Candidatus Electryoneaceae bacterium]
DILVVPQFTLYGHLRKGYRPSFSDAAKPGPANEMFEHFCDLLAETGIIVHRGQFGARMEVELINSGPVTIILETK